MLKHINLSNFIQRYNVKTFVESGTGRGDGLFNALKFPFESYYSIEIMEDQIESLRRMFKNSKNVTILPGISFEVFEEILPKIDNNIFFWLDAHYPGADLGLKGFEDERDLDVRLPLSKEIETISRLRAGFKDVIVCDDLRIYEKGPFQSKNLEEIGLGHIARYDVDPFFLLAETHEITKLSIDTGMAICLPK